MNWFIVMLILVVMITLLAPFWYLRSPLIEFVSPEYMKHVVQNASYFQNLNAIDLHVRNANTVDNYKLAYINNVHGFTSKDVVLLYNIVHHINKLTRHLSWYLYVPWKFCKVDQYIEDGYPHTLHDVIVLSDTFLKRPFHDQVRILMHEKMHVYQRKAPLHCQSLYSKWGYEMYTGAIPSNIQNKIRSNPDVEHMYVYNNRILIAQIYHKNAQTLRDSSIVGFDIHTWTPVDIKHITVVNALGQYISQLENPNEIMACLFPIIIKKEPINHTWTHHMLDWMTYQS